MKGGGGNEHNKPRSSWKNSLIMIFGPPYASLRGHPLLKVTVSLAALVLLMSIYQSFSSLDSTLHVWLSLSLGSRSSSGLASSELSQLPEESPASAILPHSPTLSPSLELSSDSRFVESLNPMTPADSNPSLEETVAVVETDENMHQKSDHLDAQKSGLQQQTFDSDDPGSSVNDKDPLAVPGNTGDSGPSSMEKYLPPGFTEAPGQHRNSSDADFPSMETDAIRESEDMVSSETTSMAVVEKDITDDGEITNQMKEKNARNRTGKTTGLGAIPGQEAAFPREAEREDDPQVSPAQSVPGNQSQELKPPKPTLSSPSVDAQLAVPPQIMEKPMGERRVQLEQQLLAAKQAIDEATPADNDPSLYPVVYHNASAFSKSYKLMEEMFRIYVYQEGNRTLVHTGPLLGIYASEGKFIDRINRGSPFIEKNPDLAHMFYLPYSVTQMTLTIYVEGSRSMQPLNTFVKEYVEEVAAKYPFWNRTHGADHFFVSCHDWGPPTARDHEELRTNAVKVVCNADVTEEYVIGKDASLPEIYLHSDKPIKVGGPGASRRSFLAFFAGQMHGHVRPILIEQWKDKDPDMKIYEVLPKEIAKKMDYVQHMKNSKYCICAAGFEVNSPRIVESIYYDCVPVIIADNFVLPFSDVLNWSTFSVTIPESEIPNLKSILLSISEKQYRAMQKRLSKVRQHFLWNDEPQKYDVFLMILHSVWMSRLTRLNP